MTLKPGDSAPSFTLPTKTADGPKLITPLPSVNGKKIVLLFFPMAFTGVCTTEFCDVTQGLAAYQALDADVYGISGDNPFAQEAWAQKEKIGVTLLSDYEHQVAQDYGVAYTSFLPDIGLPMGGVPKRSAFVIDGSGVIRYAEIKEDARELPDFQAIQACLKNI